MMDWTGGYVAGVNYTHGYYTELNPLRIQPAFLKAGLITPPIGTACELGFGQGVSLNIHAAASLAEWYGTDFNPSQAAFARELARASTARASLFDDAFEDFARRSDLPDFDYIGLHGIWSWISDQNRAVLVDFIRRKLRVGGVVYVSYNTQPGWAAFAPLRHLMTEHAHVLGSEGKGIVHRIDDALDFADRLLKTNPGYGKANPAMAPRVEKLKGQNRQYLAHEYFNRDWHPMPFAAMAEWLAPAKLTFACSAHYPDQVDSVNLSGEQQAFLKDIPDATFRESVRDFMVNQQFRKDYWVKGSRKAPVVDLAEMLRNTRVLLISPRDKVPLKIQCALGEVSMNEEIYNPILDHLADHKPKTLGQLDGALASQGIRLPALLEAFLLLAGTGHLAPVQNDEVIRKVKKQTEALNGHLMSLARSHNDIDYLASPVTGGGVAANRFEQLFLLARGQGHKTPEAWASFVWNLLASQGKQLVKDGKALPGAEENLAELTRQAENFATVRLPVLKVLQIA